MSFPAPNIKYVTPVADARAAREQLRTQGYTAFYVDVAEAEWMHALEETSVQVVRSTRFLKDPPTLGEARALLMNPGTVKKWRQHNETQGFLSPFATSVEQYCGSRPGLRHVLGAKPQQNTYPCRIRVQQPGPATTVYAAERATAHLEGDEPFVRDSESGQWRINTDPDHPNAAISGLTMWGVGTREFIMWEIDAAEDVSDLQARWEERHRKELDFANFMKLDTEFLHHRFPGKRTVFRVRMEGVKRPVLLAFCQSRVHEVTLNAPPGSYVNTCNISFQHRDLDVPLPQKSRYIYKEHLCLTQTQMHALCRAKQYHPGVYSSGTLVGNLGRYGSMYLKDFVSEQAFQLADTLGMVPYLLPWDLLPAGPTETDLTIRPHTLVTHRAPKRARDTSDSRPPVRQRLLVF